ncbi:hypothetical protein FB451DRAFT_1259800 [Mycena latifolia]|nr:hypothetical protein FB451DRAFT_1259800 [Mycena latifolia]
MDVLAVHPTTSNAKDGTAEEERGLCRYYLNLELLLMITPFKSLVRPRVKYQGGYRGEAADGYHRPWKDGSDGGSRLESTSSHPPFPLRRRLLLPTLSRDSCGSAFSPTDSASLIVTHREKPLLKHSVRRNPDRASARDPEHTRWWPWCRACAWNRSLSTGMKEGCMPERLRVHNAHTPAPRPQPSGARFCMHASLGEKCGACVFVEGRTRCWRNLCLSYRTLYRVAYVLAYAPSRFCTNCKPASVVDQTLHSHATSLPLPLVSTDNLRHSLNIPTRSESI